MAHHGHYDAYREQLTSLRQSFDSLHIPSSSGAASGKHAMCNGARQGGKGDKVGVRVNGVEVPGDI